MAGAGLRAPWHLNHPAEHVLNGDRADQLRHVVGICDRAAADLNSCCAIELNYRRLVRPCGVTPFGSSPRRARRRGTVKSRNARNLIGMKRLGEYTKLTGRGEG